MIDHSPRVAGYLVGTRDLVVVSDFNRWAIREEKEVDNLEQQNFVSVVKPRKVGRMGRIAVGQGIFLAVSSFYLTYLGLLRYTVDKSFKRPSLECLVQHP